MPSGRRSLHPLHLCAIVISYYQLTSQLGILFYFHKYVVSVIILCITTTIELDVNPRDSNAYGGHEKEHLE